MLDGFAVARKLVQLWHFVRKRSVTPSRLRVPQATLIDLLGEYESQCAKKGEWKESRIDEL